MRILIRDRYRIFSHKPGSHVLLPFSQYALQIFPTKIVFIDLQNKVLAEIEFEFLDPPENFTVELNLEKGIIAVHGTASGSFFRVFAAFDKTDQKIVIAPTKLKINIIEDPHHLIKIADILPKIIIGPERISFGIFKKPDYERIQAREDLREILPLWHALAKQVPFSKADFSSPSLLSELKEAIKKHKKEMVMPLFKALFRTGFESVFFPHLIDDTLRGYKLQPIQAATSLAMISEGAALLRSLLFKYEDERLELIPMLPKELSSGRMTGCLLEGKTLFDCEWRSKKLVRAAFSPLQEGKLFLSLPKEIKSYRFRDLKNNITLKNNPEDPLHLKEGAYILLDKFIY